MALESAALSADHLDMIDFVTPAKQYLHHIVESAAAGADDSQMVKHPFLPGDFDGGFGDGPGANGRPRSGFFGNLGFHGSLFDRLRGGFGRTLLALEQALKELAQVEFGSLSDLMGFSP
jgi:hypothetical protein